MATIELSALENKDTNKGVSESHLYLWRSIIALAHENRLFSEVEKDKISAYTHVIQFSDEQRAIIDKDLNEPKKLGKKLTWVIAPEDQVRFFQFARVLHWGNGDMVMQEQVIMDTFLREIMITHDINPLKAALNISHTSPAIVAFKNDPAFTSRSLPLSQIILKLFPELDLGTVTSDAGHSEFNMIRALFALAHADGHVSPDEKRFLSNLLATTPLNDEQRAVLKDDLKTRKDIETLFDGIKMQEHRSRFFYLARLLCWSDGDYDKQEQTLMMRLKDLHVKTVNLESMVGKVTLEFEDDEDNKSAGKGKSLTADAADTRPGLAKKILGFWRKKES